MYGMVHIEQAAVVIIAIVFVFVFFVAIYTPKLFCLSTYCVPVQYQYVYKILVFEGKEVFTGLCLSRSLTLLTAFEEKCE